MDWRVKAAVQGTMSVLPGGRRLNGWFQRHITRGVIPTVDSVERKWSQSMDLVSLAQRKASLPDLGWTALELGTGWQPVAPLALRAAGAGEVLTVDLEPLLTPAATGDTLRLVRDGIRHGSLECRIERAALLDELDAALAGESAPEEQMRTCGVVPVQSELADLIGIVEPADLTVSNNTLEHIPEDDLHGLLEALAQLTDRRGATAHFIDLKDHYAGFDPSIGPYNYLRYTDRKWRWFNNRLHHQNRLRSSDYLSAFESAGFSTVAVETEQDDRSQLPVLAPHFHRYEQSDLVVHTLRVLATPG